MIRQALTDQALARTGARVIKRHDSATTPLRRLLDQFPTMIDPHDLARLETCIKPPTSKT